ncbi:RICIN domain-containing protein [Streptomyces sp. NPDC050803]|uniref:RICIN domain-containing protein n=1 Tax=unclassified Streptomyces TaxID=2593676 RepID=UPI003431ADB5
MAQADDRDARLTELLRADSATAYAALQELRARHLPAVLAYARLCTTSDSVARQLAAQTFTLAARETARGIDPGEPWRHRLLLLSGRLAGQWSAGERAAGLDPGLLLVLNSSGPGGPVPPMLPAFRSLPARVQGLIWYAAVEREPDATTARFLGVTREDVTYGTAAAVQQLGRACLRARLTASDDPDCRDFDRLIEESVRPDSPRGSADLYAHMAHCATCTAAHEELSALRDDPRRTLGEGLLSWAGTAYVMDDPAPPAPEVSGGTWPLSRRLALVSAALGVALAPLLLFLLTQGGSATGGQDPVSAVDSPTGPPPPPVTVTATVSATPSTKSPSPTKSSKPPTTARPKPSSPSPSPTPTHYPPGDRYAQVVNVASGRCLDVVDGFDKGVDVVTAPCTGSPTQRWRADVARGVLQSAADPDYCLDSRGATDRGVGIWPCSSVDGRNGQNLRFAVDAAGLIRPAIAPDHAVTPDGDNSVQLEPATGETGQRWRAGAT